MKYILEVTNTTFSLGKKGKIKRKKEEKQGG